MSFSEALEILKRGGNISRQGWNGKGMFLELIRAHEWGVPSDDVRATRYSKRLPWIGIFSQDGFFVPWVASQTDLLADDWE